MNNMVPSGYDSQFAMEKSTIFKFGKPSISTRAIFNSKLLNNQRVYGGGAYFQAKPYYKMILSRGMPYRSRRNISPIDSLMNSPMGKYISTKHMQIQTD